MKLQFVNIVRNFTNFTMDYGHSENVFTFSLNEHKHPLVKYVNGDSSCDSYLGNYGQYNLLTTNDEHSILKLFFMGYPISNKKCFDLYVDMKPDLVFSSMNPFINKYISKMYDIHQPKMWIHSSNSNNTNNNNGDGGPTNFVSVSRQPFVMHFPEYKLHYDRETLVKITKE